MANTATVSQQFRGEQQFQGAFSEMWAVTATISDQDSVGATTSNRFSLTVAGVALGDMVIGASINNDLSDGTDLALLDAKVTAANTVTFDIHADDGAYAADDLNGSVVKILIGRPSW